MSTARLLLWLLLQYSNIIPVTILQRTKHKTKIQFNTFNSVRSWHFYYPLYSCWCWVVLRKTCQFITHPPAISYHQTHTKIQSEGLVFAQLSSVQSQFQLRGRNPRQSVCYWLGSFTNEIITKPLFQMSKYRSIFLMNLYRSGHAIWIKAGPV